MPVRYATDPGAGSRCIPPLRDRFCPGNKRAASSDRFPVAPAVGRPGPPAPPAGCTVPGGRRGVAQFGQAALEAEEGGDGEAGRAWIKRFAGSLGAGRFAQADGAAPPGRRCGDGLPGRRLRNRRRIAVARTPRGATKSRNAAPTTGSPCRHRARSVSGADQVGRCAERGMHLARPLLYRSHASRKRGSKAVSPGLGPSNKK